MKTSLKLLRWSFLQAEELCNARLPNNDYTNDQNPGADLVVGSVQVCLRAERCVLTSFTHA